MKFITNPFNTTFGSNPSNSIKRRDDMSDIIHTFSNEPNGSHVFIITGPRGSGKTALLASCKNEIQKDMSWLVVDVNPEENIQVQLASGIFNKGKMNKLFLKKEFNFSFKGFGFSIEGDEPISDVNALLEKMFDYIKAKNMRVLVLLDEVINNQYVRSFIHQFSILYRNEYPIFFLMTGLYENVSSLENSKSLTFLYRAPKIDLKPLDSMLVANSYMELLSVDYDTAKEMSKFVKGYAFAYQLLGSIMWTDNVKEINKHVILLFDSSIANKSYNKIWSDLSSKEREILTSIAQSNDNTNKEIMDSLNLKKTELSVYKKRLSDKGILDVSERGINKFTLPRFKEFIINTIEFY